MSLAQKIAKHTILQVIAKVLGTALGLISVGIITRYLGAEGYGYYATITGFLQFFGILVDFGLTLTTGQMLGHSKWNDELLFSNILSFRIITAFFFLAIAPFIALFFPYPPLVKIGIAITSASFFFMSINQIFLGFYQKQLNLIYVSLAEIINRIFLFISIAYIAYSDLGLYALLIAITLSNAVQLLILFIPARKYTQIKWSIEPQIYKDIVHTTWPIALSIALNLIYLKTDILFLSIYQTPEQVGFYSAAYKIIEVLVTIPLILCGMLLPLLSKFWNTQNRDQFKQLIQQGFDALSLIIIPLIFGTMMTANQVMVFIAGSEFNESGLLLKLLMWGAGMIFINAVFAHAIVAIKKQKQTIYIYGISAIIGLSAYAYFIPIYGTIAAASITIITEAIVAILIIYTFYKETTIICSLKKWISYLSSALAMTFFLYLTQSLHLLIQISGGVIVYGMMVILTKGITPSFIRQLIQLKRLK